MKIAVCLPSFNEAKNIGNITRIVDQGLTDLVIVYPDAQVEIINFDSNSADNTAGIFLETKTNHPKHSMVIEDGLGKGKNILEFCEYVANNNIDYCLTIDSDIISATPDWVARLLQPLIINGAGYVIPVYERSRFEGSSTSHFAFPFIYALTGNVIRQPIAGDFAFTKKIALAMTESNINRNESIQRYGVDIFMTITAIGVGSKICQVDLDRKVHAPSFSKLEYMFPQIAASALLSINAIKSLKKVTSEFETKNNILASLHFPHKEASREMRRNALAKLNNVTDKDWIDEKLIAIYKNIASEINVDEEEMIDAWTSVLSSWINHFLTVKLTPTLAKQAGEELLPFFVLRAISFWFWAETVEANKVEIFIRKQAEILKCKVKTL